MNKRFLAVLVACLLLSLLNAEEEPSYQGKTLSQWIEALKDENWLVRSGAADALATIGPDAKAAPALVNALKDEDMFACGPNFCGSR